MSHFPPSVPCPCRGRAGVTNILIRFGWGLCSRCRWQHCMQLERHREEFGVTLQDFSSVQPVFHCGFLYLMDTGIPALTLRKTAGNWYCPLILGCCPICPTKADDISTCSSAPPPLLLRVAMVYHQERTVAHCLHSLNAAAGAALTPEGALGSSQCQSTALCTAHSLFGFAQKIVVVLGVCLAGLQAVLGFKQP